MKPSESSQPIRVFHVVENLNGQAVETWLLRVLSASAEKHPHIRWSFFCVLGTEGKHDQLARTLGAEVIHSPSPIGDKVRFMRALREVMRRGHYDVLHCHHDVMSAAYLLAAQSLPFKKRIVHVHNTSLSLPTSSALKAGLAREPMKQICLRMSDQIIGISKEALESLVGTTNNNSPSHRVIHYAVDTERFSTVALNPEFRRGLGFAADSKILLFVGRLNAYKNPSFVLDILEQLTKKRPDVVAIFAGAGNDEELLRRSAAEKGLANHVSLLGFRDDVPELMANSDVLLWPSLEEPKEGLGLGIVEAQAAGLPILMSQSVPTEAIVVPKLVDVLPLNAGADAWSERVSQILERERPDRLESGAAVEASSFSMAQGVGNILALYELAS